MDYINLVRRGYSDIDHLYVTDANGDGTSVNELNRLMVPVEGSPYISDIAYIKMPSVTAESSSALQWDDIQTAVSKDGKSPTFVHLAKNGNRPNSTLDTFFVVTEDDSKTIDTSDITIYARCELNVYKDIYNNWHLLIFTYKSADVTDCAHARGVCTNYSASEFISGSVPYGMLTSAKLYDYNLTSNAITDRSSVVYSATDVNDFYYVLDSCSSDLGITLITGYAEQNGTYIGCRYQVIHVSASDGTVNTTVELSDERSIEGAIQDYSFYPSCFVYAMFNGYDSAIKSRLYAYDSACKMLLFVPLDTGTNWNVITSDLPFNNYKLGIGRINGTFDTNEYNQYDTIANVYVYSYPFSIYLARVKELNVMHSINDTQHKSGNGGLQSVLFIPDATYAQDTNPDMCYVDFAPRYVARYSRVEALITVSSYNNFFHGHPIYTYRLKYDNGQDYIEITLPDYDSTPMGTVKCSVPLGRDDYRLTHLNKFALIQCTDKVIILRDDGYMTFIS